MRALASHTEAKIGRPSKTSPAFFGLTPATKQVRPSAYSRHAFVWNCPVLPVIPCVTTRVLRSTRMLIVGSLWSSRASLAGGGHDLLRSLGHRVGCDDRQSRIGQYLLAQRFVGASHPDHQRNAQLDRARSGHDAFGDRVALHDAAEDVDQDRPELGV